MQATKRLRDRRVRDLAWTIGAPSICVRPADSAAHWVQTAECLDELREHRSWLEKLDSDPAVLHAFLSDRPTRRLGHYFESLHSFWFGQAPNRDLLAEHIVLRKDKQTVGELDFVYARAGRTLHLEVAVKFYLRVGHAAHPASYVGPGLRDRFDWKLDKIKRQQSQRLSLAVAADALRAVGLDPTGIRSEVRLKGVLFERFGDHRPRPPEVSETCLRGEWLRLDALDSIREFGTEWCLLDRLEWLSGPAEHRPALTFDALSTLVKAKPHRPMHVCSCVDGVLDRRFFVVPNDFEERAAQAFNDAPTSG